jgi:hypothetical protein
VEKQNGIINMKENTIKISEDDLKNVVQAYQVLEAFLNKYLPVDEIYQPGFLNSLTEAKKDVDSGRLQEIKSFADFIG